MDTRRVASSSNVSETRPPAVVGPVVQLDDGDDDDDYYANANGYDFAVDEECVLDDATGDLPEYCRCTDDAGCEALEINGDAGSGARIKIQAGPERGFMDGIEDLGDVAERIEEARREQREGCGGESAADGLYERDWIPVGGDEGDNGEQGRVTAAPSFTAMQFNALAEGLSSAPRTALPPPFGANARDDSKKGSGGYGGFTAVPRPETVLDFRLRRWRLLEVLLGKYCRGGPSDLRTVDDDGSSRSLLPFDLIALEELDRYHGFFHPLLRLLGYRSTFIPKPRAPGVELGYYSDGCALFWKSDAFRLIEPVKGGNFVAGGSQVYLVATLRHVESGRDVVVGVTHLKAKKGRSNERVRAEQLSELLGELGAARDQAAAKANEDAKEVNADDVPVLLMGDFNAEPYGECVCSLRNHPAVRLTSAYDLDEDGAYTTWKTRGESTVRRIIDYVFHSGCVEGERKNGGGGGDGDAGSDFRCTHVLSVPHPDEVEPHGLPGLRQPSDHFAVAARFELPSLEKAAPT